MSCIRLRGSGVQFVTNLCADVAGDTVPVIGSRGSVQGHAPDGGRCSQAA